LNGSSYNLGSSGPVIGSGNGQSVSVSSIQLIRSSNVIETGSSIAADESRDAPNRLELPTKQSRSCDASNATSGKRQEIHWTSNGVKYTNYRFK